MAIVGVISDTHGLLRAEAIEALRGSDFIVHAGDVGAPEILGKLGAIAPVTAVRGNVDGGSWARRLPKTEVLEVDGISIYVLHILEELDVKPEAAGMSVVVYGHSHMPKPERKNGVLFLIGEGGGRGGFNLAVRVGKVGGEGGEVGGEIVELGVD